MSGDHTKREVTVTRVEYAVPSGAEIKDFGLVQEWAWQDCARRNGWDVNGSRDDNWCTVVAHDEHVVFAFTVETMGGPAIELDRLRKVEARAYQCEIERDSFRRQAEKQGEALGRVRALLARTDASDDPGLDFSDWPKLVRDAIEGRS